MAYSRINHPDFGTREEDWPDLDIDSDTEEGREKKELAEAALFATIHRSITKRNRQPAYPNIPPPLYLKAEEHQDQLTAEERNLLLSRGDLVGQALSDPASLTAQEIHELCLWPPPAVVRASIQRATGGSLSTPTELYAKMKEALDRGELQTTFSDEAIRLPARRFHALDDAAFKSSDDIQFACVQGWGNALNLLGKRQGLDLAVFQACAIYNLDKKPSDAGQQPAWVAAIQDELSSVPEAVNIISSKMLRSQELYAKGQLSDQEHVARTWEHLASLKLASGPQPIPYPPLSTLIGSLDSLQQAQEQGKASIEEVIQRNMLYLSRFNMARIANIKEDPEPSGLKQRVSQSDMLGTGDWPPSSRRVTPYSLYLRETPLSGFAAEDAWASLSEAERAAYRAQHETLRLAAWDQHQARVAEGISTMALLPSRDQAPVAAHESQPQPQPRPQRRYERNTSAMPSSGFLGPPEMPQVVTAFRVYREELAAGVGYEDASVGWDALTTTQKNVYTTKAAERDKAAMAEYQSATNAFLYGG